MKVLLINGSPNKNGCTYTALTEVVKILEMEGISCEIIHVGNQAIQDCIGCRKCAQLDGACIFENDIVNEIIEKAKTADGFVFGTPVYYAHPSGRVLSVLDRVFFAGSKVFRHKPGAVIASARRAGTTASIDVLTKYLTIAEMPVASSTYWNMVHGSKPEDVEQDLEGLQTMRNIGRNMAWLMKCIEAGKEKGIQIPATERVHRTGFIR